MQSTEEYRVSVLALIPARGGSKGLPGKNLRPLAGVPLLAHSILQAQAARHVDRVCVSTDEDAIAEVARAHGAEVIPRPSAISGDTASSESALLHALDWLQEQQAWQPGLLCFLQCTSPVREPHDIDAAVDRLRAEHADSLLSVSPSHRFLWRRGADGAGESINYEWHRRPRRQDMAPQFVENGSIYLMRPALLRATGNRLGGRIALYEMGEHAALEIDSELDFRLVEAVLTARRRKEPS
jgi:N-acylneuraminate cytidylyltransferase